jgi:hypothetical protein
MKGRDMAMHPVILMVEFIAILSLTFFSISTSCAASIDYQYDNLNRLRMETYEDGKTAIYEYDEVGNRTSNYTTQFTAVTQSGSANPSGSMTIQEGTSRTFYFAPIPHYHIYNVIVDGISKGAISSYSFINSAAPQTIQAQFAIDRFYLNVYRNVATYGKIASSISGIDCGADCSEYYDYGTSVTLTATPSSDAYYFTGWSGYCSGTGPCTLFMNSDKYVYAFFAMKNYTLSTSTVFTPSYMASLDPKAVWGWGGTITPSSPNVGYDGYQTFTITPSSGYKITNVVVDGQALGAVSSYTFLNVKASHSLVAQFYYNYNRPIPIVVYLNNPNGGSVTSPSGIYCGTGGTICSKTFDYSTYVKLTAKSNMGYSLREMSGAMCGYYIAMWTRVDENGVPTGEIHCITSTYASQNITCNFYPLTIWPINASPIGAGSISPSARTYFPVGANKTYSIAPSSGASIADVIVDGVSLGPISSYTFNNISTYHNITARFSCPNNPVRIVRTLSYYPTLQAAYDASIGGDRIQSVEGLVDNLSANRDISVTLEGGYDCNYTSNDGKTTVMKGTMTTTAGAVTLKNFALF